MDTTVDAVDIFFLICFIPAVIGGLMNGLVRQVASLLALVLGIWAGWHFSSLVAQGITIFIKDNDSLVNIISFAIVFIVVLILVNMIGRGLSKIVQLALLGWLDKLLGVIFGIVKYAFVLSVLIYFVNSLNDLYSFIPDDFFSGSKLFPILKKIAPSVFPYLEEFNLF
jgi:membrane protein required for colicin V production